jgi:hypothetical protein
MSIDLTIAPQIGQSLPKDTYVALRIGDVQKLGRIGSERRYNFPESAIGDHRYGKIEILKKVSGCTVGINPEKDGFQDIDVLVNSQSVKLSVSCKANPKPPPKEKVAKEEKPRVKAARSYLDTHNLELVLKDAMQEVIRAMPEDPIGFIAKHLLDTRGRVVKGSEPPQASPDELREKAKGILLDSTADGRLESALSSITASREPGTTGEQMSTDELRAQARQTLMSATQDGRLNGALEQVKSGGAAPGVEQLRAQAKNTLLSASANGELDKALAQVKSAPAEGGGEEADVETLRAQAKNTLLNATATGKLDSALAQVKGGDSQAAPDVEQLRQQAKNTLLDATKTGNLDKALASVKDKGEQQLGPETEALRQQAKQTLLNATDSGKLDEALAEIKSQPAEGGAADPETEELKAQAKQTLLAATKTGKLNEALEEVKGGAADPETEELREQAKATLLDATKSGKLTDALESVKGASADPEAEELREQAKQTLLNATESGKLNDALEEVKQASGEAPEGSAQMAEQYGSGRPESAEEAQFREETKNSLLQAAKTGQLSEELAPEAEETRKQAQAALLEGSADGKLEESLAQVKAAPDSASGAPGDAAAPGEDAAAPASGAYGAPASNAPAEGAPAATPPGGSPRDEGELRQIAKQAIDDATSSESLAKAMAEVKNMPVPENMEEVKEQAYLHLMEAANNGQLDAAIENLEAKGVPKEEVEALKAQVKGVLATAAEAGELDAALKASSPTGAAGNIEQLRQQAKSTLMESMENGELTKVMAEVKKPGDQNESEELRQEVKGVLMGASGDGRLQEQLAAVRGGSEAAPAGGEMVPYASPGMAASSSSTGIVPLASSSGNALQGFPSGNMSAEELQMALANGLREAINASVKDAVGDVVNHAFTQLKHEMVKRDAQSEELAKQMNELHRSVTDLQATVVPSSPAAGSPAR